ncbi:hypothetical protein AB0M11_31975 [Streptomyces sp. NPDC051987]|uniref:hypothetical protein n=1 Tax=Streptomyces sp. NPDC051987 TaxID=3155808 RepID=UPI003428A647
MATVLLAPGRPGRVPGAELVALGIGACLSLPAIGRNKRESAVDDGRLTDVFDRRDTDVVVMLLFVAAGVLPAFGHGGGLRLLLPASAVAFVRGC